MNCTWCNQEIKHPSKYQRDKFKRDNRVYCCKKCGKEYSRKTSSETMSKTNKQYASGRMKVNNPMFNPKSKEKMKTTLRAIGHKPKIQGGNGKGPTIQQLSIASTLGWDMEVSVKTGMKKGSGYPQCYKIDIANCVLKIGIEIDGRSHLSISRKKQDKKKDDFLKSIGWTIIRFTNKEVEKNHDRCIQKVLGFI